MEGLPPRFGLQKMLNFVSYGPCICVSSCNMPFCMFVARRFLATPSSICHGHCHCHCQARHHLAQPSAVAVAPRVVDNDGFEVLRQQCAMHSDMEGRDVSLGGFGWSRAG